MLTSRRQRPSSNNRKGSKLGSGTYGNKAPAGQNLNFICYLRPTRGRVSFFGGEGTTEYGGTHECLRMFAITGLTDHGIYIFSCLRYGITSMGIYGCSQASGAYSYPGVIPFTDDRRRVTPRHEQLEQLCT